MGEREEAHGIGQIECLKQDRMFMEHLDSMSEDTGKEESTFFLYTLMIYDAH